MFLIRAGIGVIMLLAALEAWKMASILENDRLFLIGKRICYILLLFGTLRLIGTFVDGWLAAQFATSVAWMSTIATYGFWVATWGFFFNHRRILQKEVSPTELEQIKQGLDMAIDGMKIVKVKLDRRIHQIENGSHV